MRRKIVTNHAQRPLLSGADLKQEEQDFHRHVIQDEKEFLSYRFVRYLGRVYDLQIGNLKSNEPGWDWVIIDHYKRFTLYFKYTTNDTVVIGRWNKIF